jgi:hypothetical protein
MVGRLQRLVLCAVLTGSVVRPHTSAMQLRAPIQPSQPAVVDVPPQLPTRLLRPSDLVYQGAFMLPGGRIGTSAFAYGGPIAVNQTRIPVSLFVAGDATDQQLAEVAVPELRTGVPLTGFAPASVLQTFVDPAEGRRLQVCAASGCGAAVDMGGELVYHNRLVFTFYDSYDASVTQWASHFTSGLDLSVTGDVRGPFQVGGTGATGFVSGYMGLIPLAWQSAFGGPVFTGQCCISVISRTSSGPSVSVIDPDKIGVTDPVPSTYVLAYGLDHPLADYQVANGLFNTTSQVKGVVFPDGTRSVLFFGRHGLGQYCYGLPEECGDTADLTKGPHQQPYVSQVWAYDAADLVAVRNGQRQPWDVKPYDTWTFALPYNHPNQMISGAALDPGSGRVFISATGINADGRWQLVHVFQVTP